MISVVRLRYGGRFCILRSIFMMIIDVMIPCDGVRDCLEVAVNKKKEGNIFKDVLTLSMCA